MKNETVWLKESHFDDSFDKRIDEKFSLVSLVNAAFHVRHHGRGIHPSNL